MNITGREILKKFVAKHSICKTWVNNWVADVENSSWNSTHDIKARYPLASFVKKLVIFNVKGNNYRLEVIVAFNLKMVRIVWVGTHAESDERNKSR